MRQLYISINQRQVGQLFEENDIWAFQYDEAWLDYKECFSICPKIPLQRDKQTDGSTKRHIQWFFDNLLPEEGARTLLIEDINVNEADSFGILSIVGAESAGAITLNEHRGGETEGSVLPLTIDDLNTRIENLPNIPLNNKENKRMSIAGAQHKMLIILEGEKFFEPCGSTPSSHILKPEHSRPERYWQTVRNEWFVMNLAREIGLQVPITDVSYFPLPAYIIERFDRKGKYPEQSRTHALDGCQLLGLSRDLKYNQSNVGQLNQFSEMMRGKGAAKLAILKWSIFNAVVGNTDAHLKNLSCLVSPTGYVLSPFYDLISTAIYEKTGMHLQAPLSQKMGNALLLNELKREDILVYGERLGLDKKLSIIVLDKILNQIELKADKLIQHVTELQDVPSQEGELRMLREIRYNMISEMVTRLN